MVQGSNASRDKKVFSSPKCPDQLCCPSHPLFDQYCVSCLGVEQPGCEVNHASPSIAEVKNGWSSTSTLPISPHFMDRDKLYLFCVIYGCNWQPDVLRCMSVCGNVLWVSSYTFAECDDREHTANVTASSHIVWTAAQDRQLVACCLETGEVMVDVPTLGGCVYCIAVSPVDSMR